MDEKIILLVEDNPDDQFLTLRAFRKHQFMNQVVVASDALEAMNFLFGAEKNGEREATVAPQLILLDLKLPKMDGLELLRRIREHERTCYLPVVVLTSSVEERDVVSAYTLGANSYVRKPVEFGEFSEVIRQVGAYWLSLNELPPPFSSL